MILKSVGQKVDFYQSKRVFTRGSVNNGGQFEVVIFKALFF